MVMNGDKWNEIGKVTFEAFIDILLLAGVYKSHGESTKTLWKEKQVGLSVLLQCLKNIISYLPRITF